MPNKRLKIILFIITLLLLIPFVAMQFTEEVKWQMDDFIVAGVLLLGTGLLVEFVLRNVIKTSYRITLCVVILVLLFLIWTELAVGIFGTVFSGS